MNFIHFGRLVSEKGFDLIVESLSLIVSETGGLPGNFYIFGEGDLKNTFLERFAGSPLFENASSALASDILSIVEESSLPSSTAKIYFFGWREHDTIFRVLETSHFCLMPSRFLETFGLSALESLSYGVPVLGFAKGGLIPFIPEQLSISHPCDHKNTRALADLILEVSLYPRDEWRSLSDRARHVSEQYSEDRWMNESHSLCTSKNPDAKKILLVTDYTTVLGGIETHVHNIARVLRSRGYEVELFGWDIGKSKWTRLRRLLGLVISCYNLVFARKLRKRLSEYSPDIVWFHSVSRFLGPLCLREVVGPGEYHSMITYHDLGTWSAYPSLVESEDMIPLTPSFASFISVLRSKYSIGYVASIFKYLQVLSLRKYARKIDTHIVPSDFLVKYVYHISQVEKEKIHVLNLFL